MDNTAVAPATEPVAGHNPEVSIHLPVAKQWERLIVFLALINVLNLMPRVAAQYFGYLKAIWLTSTSLCIFGLVMLAIAVMAAVLRKRITRVVKKSWVMGLIVGIIVSIPLAAYSAYLTYSMATSRNTLRIHGSKVIGVNCMKDLAIAFLKSQRQATAIHIEENGDETIISGSMQTGDPLAIEIKPNGTWNGLKDLDAKKADIAMAFGRLPDWQQWNSYPHLSGEMQNRRELASRLRNLKTEQFEYVVGFHGIAIISGRRDYGALSQDQVCNIFQGILKTWHDLDQREPAIPIHLMVRNRDSGVRQSFNEHCYQGDDKIADSATPYEDDEKLADAVSQDQNTIGFVATQFALPAAVIPIGNDLKSAQLPTLAAIGLHQYPLTSSLYLYWQNPDHEAKDFMDFVKSPKGRAVITRHSEFALEEIQWAKPSLGNSAPGDYKQITGDAERVTLPIIFDQGRYKLSEHAQDDLRRLSSFLENEHRKDKSLRILGFDDSTDAAVNCELAAARAEEVAKALGTSFTNRMKAGFSHRQRSDVGNDGRCATPGGTVEIWVSDVGPSKLPKRTTCPIPGPEKFEAGEAQGTSNNRSPKSSASREPGFRLEAPKH